MSNANAKFGTRSWLNSLVSAYLGNGGSIRYCNSPRPRGGRLYTIIL
jgi:hypothetical protein